MCVLQISRETEWTKKIRHRSVTQTMITRIHNLVSLNYNEVFFFSEGLGRIIFIFFMILLLDRIEYPPFIGSFY